MKLYCRQAGRMNTRICVLYLFGGRSGFSPAQEKTGLIIVRHPQALVPFLHAGSGRILDNPHPLLAGEFWFQRVLEVMLCHVRSYTLVC